MSFARMGAVFRLELRDTLRRPLFWTLVALLVLMSLGLSAGNVQIGTGDSSTGGKRAWITNEFAISQWVSLTGLLLYSFFASVAAGMSVIRDDEAKVSDLLHSTPLRAHEYVWGKFLGTFTAFALAAVLHLGSLACFSHLLPRSDAAEVRGPFVLWSYVAPGLKFLLPLVIFVAGTSFAIGERNRKPILVFVLPVALLLTTLFFLLTWSPTWLDPRWNRLLMALEPSGFRWLNETYLRVDRGVDFYNHSTVAGDWLLIGSRSAFAALGIGSVLWSAARLKSQLRGSVRIAPGAAAIAAEEVPTERRQLAPLGSLVMSQRPVGWLRAFTLVSRAELRELAGQAGLYLFVPLILLQTIGNAAFAVGAFDTPLLQTSGTLAASSINTLTTLVCFLLLFYTVESLQRESTTGIALLWRSTPTHTSALIAGKVMAISVVAAVIEVAALLGCGIVLAFQGKVPFEIRPFLLLWGLVLTPTFIFWASLTAFLYSASRNRYLTYALGLGAMALTGYCQLRGWLNWATSWNLWDAVRWTDIGFAEIDGSALALNRVTVLSAAILFVILAVRLYPRRELDAIHLSKRLQPWPLLRASFPILPFVALPSIGIGVLGTWVHRGYQGGVMEKAQKDYWRRNVRTWLDAQEPALTSVDVELDLDPGAHSLRSKGTYQLWNDWKDPMERLVFTGGAHWRNVQWKLEGKPFEPKNQSGLYVFTLPTPLPPDGRLSVGFEFEGKFPDGVSKLGGGAGQFILPSSVVLTSFGSEFAPLVGFVDGVGVDEENRTDSKEYSDSFYLGRTPPAFGSPSSFTTKVTVHAPADYQVHSVGVCTRDAVEGNRRTVVWESDQPVRFYNVVAGKWVVKEGADTKIYYHPEHAYNIEEMSLALDSARKWYSEWFRPYPWKELKLSEFAGHASYAQGFATNITFSENIGFLVEDDPKTHLAFFVTAHEAAHQWWGNMLTPAKGPGGNILSEGMAHYSTMRLLEQVKGEHARREFCKRIEERYGDSRQVDSERPLVKIDGSKPGDTTVTYDRGGWVFWMTERLLGRDAMQRGLRAFMDQYCNNTDFPVLQDFTAVMREQAADPERFDRFVRDWYHGTALPEFKISGAERKQAALSTNPAGADDSLRAWDVGFEIRNVGTGQEPVTVAAVLGEPFDDAGKPNEKYREERTTVLLGPGEQRSVRLQCAFQPDRIVVDPDVHLLQLQRKLALHRF
ncbi:MAG: ABC transporter permease subunit [Planctomycetes bacterium]|nr:ABC transporter permease subunit [Planctomycetota bacterium]